MESRPTVSVLIPCHNAEHWVQQAIESAFQQQGIRLDLFVVDDGSRDGSLDVLRKYSDRLRFETGPNRGGNFARNDLLSMSSGDWVQFLDADDYLTPDKIAVQLASVADSSGQADVIYSPVITEVWRDGAAIERSVGQVSTEASLEEQWIRWQVAQTGAVLWRREALLAIGGWNEAYPCCQDNEVILRAIQAGLKFHYCPDAGAVYRIWSEGTVCRKDPARVIRYKTQLIDQMMAWLAQQGSVTPAIEAAAGQAFFEMARTWAKYDLPKAAAYQKERFKKGWYTPVGPAAPLSYRLTHRFMGFRLAEQIAAWRR